MDKNPAKQTDTQNEGHAIPADISAAHGDNGKKQAYSHQGIAETKTKRSKISVRRIGKLYLIKGLRSGPDRIFELLLTLGIFSVAAVQLFTTISNNSGTSQQTDQLIVAAKISAYAANQNSQASRNFADSARSINAGIGDAVDKLSLQARGIEAARQSSAEQSQKALDATIAQGRLDQRPWVGFFIQKRSETKELSIVDIILSNTGRTPARHVRVAFGGLLNSDETYMLNHDDEVLIRNVLEAEIDAALPSKEFDRRGPMPHGKLSKKDLSAGPRLEAGAIQPSLPISLETLSVNHYASPAKLASYFFGMVKYDDANGFGHVTEFCGYYRTEEAAIRIMACPVFNDIR